MGNKENRKDLAQNAIKVITELEESLKLESKVKDNKIVFKLKNVIYRIRKPNFDEINLLNDAKRKKYTELVDDDSYLFRKEWIEKYKKNNIDIDKMNRKISELQNTIEKVLLILATTSSKPDIDKLKKEIFEIRNEMFTINMEVTDLLSYSIEDQLLIFVNSYTTYLVLEYKKKEEWEQYFSTYEDFLKSEDFELTNQAIYYINDLIYREEEEEK